jgi:hypothetical protein
MSACRPQAGPVGESSPEVAAGGSPIGAPCTQCLRHGDLIHARKALTGGPRSRGANRRVAGSPPAAGTAAAARPSPRAAVAAVAAVAVVAIVAVHTQHRAGVPAPHGHQYQHRSYQT